MHIIIIRTNTKYILISQSKAIHRSRVNISQLLQLAELMCPFSILHNRYDLFAAQQHCVGIL